MKRGQSAMEFLMTYGWAILVILIALAALFYLGVFEPKIPPTCFISAPFVCHDIKIDEGGVTMFISNMDVNSISNINISINGQDCPDIWINDVYTNQSNTLKDKKTKIQCSGIDLDPKDKANVDFSINYLSNNLNHTILGEGIGMIETGRERWGTDVVFLLHMNGNIIDSSYYNIQGTLNGNVDCNSEGILDYGCSFDGGDDYINYESSPISGNSNFTLISWFKPIENSFTNNKFVAMVGGSSTGGRSITIGGGMCSGRSTTYNIDISEYVTEEEWYFVACVWNGTVHKAYVNGVNVGSKTTPAWNIESSGLTIGANFDGGNKFIGYIDEVFLFNRALTEEEIEDFYDSY